MAVDFPVSTHSLILFLFARSARPENQGGIPVILILFHVKVFYRIIGLFFRFRTVRDGFWMVGSRADNPVSGKLSDPLSHPGSQKKLPEKNLRIGDNKTMTRSLSVLTGIALLTLLITIGVAGAAPAVTGISPTSGPEAGDTSVTVTGTGFTGTTFVLFGSSPAASFTVDSDTGITAVSPAGSAGTVDITVTTFSGTSPVSAADQFTYVAAPVLTWVNRHLSAQRSGCRRYIRHPDRY